MNKVELEVVGGRVVQKQAGDVYTATGKTFKCIDFRDEDLSLSEFEDCTFVSCNFRAVHSAKWINSSILVCSFEKADLDWSALEKCKIRHTEFRQTSMRNMRLESCEVNNCTFDDIYLAGADIDTSHFEQSGIVRIDGIAEWGSFYIFNRNRIKCGCRWFTVEEALNHWRGKYERDRTFQLVELVKGAGWIT